MSLIIQKIKIFDSSDSRRFIGPMDVPEEINDISALRVKSCINLQIVVLGTFAIVSGIIKG